MADQPIKYDPADFPDPHQDEEFDASLTLWLLSLTPLQRLEHHEEWRQFVYAARQAATKRYGIDPEALDPPE